jgi:hypothetical protein
LPSTYTPLGFNKQASGENENTWGEVLNEEAIDLIDSAIRGRTAFTLSGSKTLTSTNGEANESRAAILHVTGGTGGTVTIPDLSKLYVVINEASGDVVISAGGATTATIGSGETAQVAADGAAAVHKVLYADFGGERLTSVGNPVEDQDAATKIYVDTAAFEAVDLPGQSTETDGAALFSDGEHALRRAIDVDDVVGVAPLASPSFTGGVDVAGGADVSGGLTVAGTVAQTGPSNANVTAIAALDIDLTAGDFFTKSISSNSTFTFSGATASRAAAFVVELTISSAAVPSWPASVDHPGGVNPSATLGNGRHVLGFITFNGGTDWLMVVVARALA